MLGEVLFKETGKTIGMRVLSADAGGVKVEVTLQTEGQIDGVAETSLWTYSSLTRPDGSIYGEGQGFMTTSDGDVLGMLGSAGAKAVGADGSIKYRGALHFQTASGGFSHLVGTVGAFEYDVDAEGNTTATVWEWK